MVNRLDFMGDTMRDQAWRTGMDMLREGMGERKFVHYNPNETTAPNCSFCGSNERLNFASVAL